MKTNLHKIILVVFFLSLINELVNCQLYDWRGPDRTGVYNETNLLTEWPENGPDLLWEINGIGNGYSSVTISENTIYITGKKEEVDVLTALTLDGKKKWETVYGKSWNITYPDSRCTATYYNGRLFVVSGQGDLVCIDTDGNIIWSVNYFKMYNASAPRHGISESPLIVGNKVIATPGGNKASVVAFNIETGNVIWEAEPLNEGTQYVNPKLVEHGGKKIVITFSTNYILAVDSENGNILWSEYYTGHNIGDERRRINHTITPIFRDGCIFVTSGYNHMGLKLKLSDDGTSAEVVWRSNDIDPHHGGVVLLDKYLYSSTYENNSLGSWICVDWTTGKTMWIKKWYNKGSIISADGMIYIYEEKSGHVGLVRPDKTKLDIINEFQITKGEGPHWAHLVIRDGNLYIRHGDNLMVYSIKAS